MAHAEFVGVDPRVTRVPGALESVAIVTGASSGLGARFATVLADAGARVVACARRLEPLEELARTQPRIVPLRCDVVDPDDRARLVETALALDGRIDICVNNAGISSGGPEQQSTVEALRVGARSERRSRLRTHAGGREPQMRERLRLRDQRQLDVRLGRLDAGARRTGTSPRRAP